MNGAREIVVGWHGTGRVEVWSLGTGKIVRGVTLANAAQTQTIGWGFNSNGDGKRVSASPSFHTIGVYNSETGVEVAKLAATTVEFVPGRNLVLAHDRIWQAFDLAKKRYVAGRPGGYLFPADSANGKVMITTTDRISAEILVWDLTQIP